MNRIKRQIAMLCSVIKIIRPILDRKAIVILLECITKVGKTMMNVLLPMILFDLITGKWNVGKMIWRIVGIFLFYAMFHYFANVFEELSEIERKKINSRMEYLIARKAMAVDYLKNEEQEFLDLKSGADFTIRKYQSIDVLIKCGGDLLCEIFILMASGIYFFIQFPILLVLIIMGIVFQTLLNNRLNEKLEVYFNNLFPINRRFEWFSNLKLDLGRQKDIRQFQMQDFIVKKIDICNENTGDIFAEMNTITCQTDLKVNFINSFVLYSGYCHNAICYFLKKVNIGEFLSLYYLLNEVYTILGKIGENLIQGKQLISYLMPIEQLFHYEEIKNDGILLEHVESICFEHLYFRYPGEELISMSILWKAIC